MALLTLILSAQVPRLWKGVTSILVMMLNTLPPSGGFTYSSTSHTLCSDKVMPLTLVMTELSGPVSLSW